MKFNFRRSVAAVSALVISASCMTFTSFTSSADETKRYEFEDADFSGKVEKEADSAASGGSVLYMKDNGTITMKVSVEKEGMYDIIMAAEGVGGAKQNNIYVNDVSGGSMSFSEGTGTYTPFTATTVKLNAGENTIKITSSWGWTKFDYIEVAPKVYDTVTGNASLSDSKATKEAKSLMSYMASVYGSHTISGQQEIYQGGPHGFETEIEYIRDLTGETPAIRGFDFLNEANILYGSEDGTTDRIIKWCTSANQYGSAGIATASWHLTVPKDFDNYKVGDKIDWNSATYEGWNSDKSGTVSSFKTENVLVEGTKENEYYMACLKKLSESLLKIQDAGVPLIFRPLHEAEGGGGEQGSWFWWGTGGSKVYKELWKLTYKTLTEDYGIHNLIWEWNGYDYATSGDWYPGDEYVDLVGYDKYSCTKYLAENNWQASLEHDDTAAGKTYWSLVNLTNKSKMVALAECDCISTLTNLQTEHATWLYFCPWYDGGSDNINFVSNEIFNRKEDLKEMYQSDYCITLEELPKNLYSGDGEFVTETKEPTESKPTEAPTEIKDVDAKLVEEDDGTAFSFSKPMGEKLYLDIDTPSNMGYTCGGACFNVKYNDVDYWVGYQWETKKSGTSTATINLANPTNVTYTDANGETVTVKDSKVTPTGADAELVQALGKEVMKLKEGKFQKWYAADSSWEEIKDLSDLKLVKAYIKESSTVEPSETETATDPTETESATTVATEPATTATEATEPTEKPTATPTEPSTSESSEATSETAENPFKRPTDIVYGDVNLDGKVTIADAVLLNKYLVKSATLNDSALYAADCNYVKAATALDVNSDDTLAILKLIVGTYESLPHVE